MYIIFCQIVSGQFLCPSNPTASPYVEVEVVGIPSDCAKWKTKAIPRNAINPIWDEAFTFHIAFEDLAFLRLTVYDGSGSGVITQRCIPVKGLKTGECLCALTNNLQTRTSIWIHTIQTRKHLQPRTSSFSWYVQNNTNLNEVLICETLCATPVKWYLVCHVFLYSTKWRMRSSLCRCVSRFRRSSFG